MIGYVRILVLLAIVAAAVTFRHRLFQSVSPPASASSAPPAVRRVDAAVETVRAGWLPGYDAVSVGKAFEGRFQNAQWNSFQTPNGVTVVEFRGTILADALDRANINSSRANPIVVRSNCIRSLGLGAAIEQDAASARVAEQSYRSNLAEIEERQRSDRGSSQKPANEYRSLVTARQQQEKSAKDLDDGREAQIRKCIAESPLTVDFQFTLSADQKKFALGYIDKDPFGESAPNVVLAFVYR